MNRYALLLAIPVSASTGAHAADPSGARYLDETDELFWFVQASDTHIGSAEIWYGDRAPEHLDLLLGQSVDAILPEFIVVTGDLVDATDGLGIPLYQHDDEWEDYEDIVLNAGMSPDYFHDLVGNHDTYSDAGASHYLDYSLWGSTSGDVHHSWTLEMPWGDYFFVGLNTSDLSGATPLLDEEGLTAEEAVFLESELAANPDSRLNFVFGHHPTHSFEVGETALRDLLSDHDVSVYGSGHDHDLDIDFIDDTLHFNMDSLGKQDQNNVALYAIDHDGLSAQALDIGRWPVVQITSPVDLGLGGTNPYAYRVSVNQTANPVRALVFDPDGINDVFMVAGGVASDMVEIAPNIWQGTWDSTVSGLGVHTVEVHAASNSGDASHTISVELAVTACDDGVDNDGNGFADFPGDEGCWGASDEEEEGWDPPDEPVDTGTVDTDDVTDTDPQDTGALPDGRRSQGGKSDPGGCGCQTSHQTGFAGWLLIFGLLTARRRCAPMS